jgi:hypothetical protein
MCSGRPMYASTLTAIEKGEAIRLIMTIKDKGQGL